MNARTVLVLAASLALTSPALADHYTDKAKSGLDAIEAKVANLSEGDVGGAVRLLRELGRVNRDLNYSRDKGKEHHTSLRTRYTKLDTKIRDTMNAKGTGGGAGDAYLVGAKKRLDDAEAKLGKLAPGDRRGAGKLVKAINLAIGELGKSQTRGVAAWKTEYERAKRLSKETRARGTAAKVDTTGGTTFEAGAGGVTFTLMPNRGGGKLQDASGKSLGAISKRGKTLQITDARRRFVGILKEITDGWELRDGRQKLLNVLRRSGGALTLEDGAGATLYKFNVSTSTVSGADGKAKYTVVTSGGRSLLRGSDGASIYTRTGVVSAEAMACLGFDSLTLEQRAALYLAVVASKPAPKPAPAGGAGSAFVKNKLRYFDKVYTRANRYLRNARPLDFQKKNERAGYEKWAKTMKETLAEIPDQADAEVKKRLEQLEVYERKLAGLISKGASTLGPDDMRRIKRIGGELTEGMAALEQAKGTVLGYEGESGYQRNPKRVATLMSSIDNKSHPSVKKLEEQLAAYNALLTKKVAVSEKELASLGSNVVSRSQAYYKTFDTRDFPPRLPTRGGVAEVKAWVAKIKRWQPKVEQACSYLRRVQQWAPVYQVDIELGNRIRRVVGNGAVIPKLIADNVGWWKQATQKADAIVPASIPKTTLADGARDQLIEIEKALKSVQQHAAFEQAYRGKTSGDLSRRITSYASKTTKIKELAKKAEEEMIAEARMPADIDDSKLTALAKRLIKSTYERLVVHRGVRSHQRDTVHHTGWVYHEDYDVFRATVAISEDGGYRMHEYVFTFSRRGVPGETLNEWVVSEVWPGRRMLRENISK